MYDRAATSHPTSKATKPAKEKDKITQKKKLVKERRQSRRGPHYELKLGRAWLADQGRSTF